MYFGDNKNSYNDIITDNNQELTKWSKPNFIIYEHLVYKSSHDLLYMRGHWIYAFKIVNAYLKYTSKSYKL